MVLAQHLAAGVDVWINNPRRPAEACGTSGMKMLVNGGLHCSILDGWWPEAYSPEVGWAIGGEREHQGEGDADDAGALYALLENQIAPEFYDRDETGIPRGWIARVRNSMTRLTEQFSSDRMVREYVEQAYCPPPGPICGDRLRGRKTGPGTGKLALEDRRPVAVPAIRPRGRAPCGDQWNFEVQAILGGLGPECVEVQLYADPLADSPAVCVPMQCEGRLHGVVDGYVFRAAVPAQRPAEHFTPRIVPHHGEAFLPMESPRTLWQGWDRPFQDGRNEAETGRSRSTVADDKTLPSIQGALQNCSG